MAEENPFGKLFEEAARFETGLSTEGIHLSEHGISHEFAEAFGGKLGIRAQREAVGRLEEAWLGTNDGQRTAAEELTHSNVMGLYGKEAAFEAVRVAGRVFVKARPGTEAKIRTMNVFSQIMRGELGIEAVTAAHEFIAECFRGEHGKGGFDLRNLVAGLMSGDEKTAAHATRFVEDALNDKYGVDVRLSVLPYFINNLYGSKSDVIPALPVAVAIIASEKHQLKAKIEVELLDALNKPLSKPLMKAIAEYIVMRRNGWEKLVDWIVRNELGLKTAARVMAIDVTRNACIDWAFRDVPTPGESAAKRGVLYDALAARLREAHPVAGVRQFVAARKATIQAQPAAGRAALAPTAGAR